MEEWLWDDQNNGVGLRSWASQSVEVYEHRILHTSSLPTDSKDKNIASRKSERLECPFMHIIGISSKVAKTHDFPVPDLLCAPPMPS
jgi:hypothetical protein